MKRLFTPKTVITALIFGAFYSLVIAYVGKIAVEYWGRPRGVAYGILGYYYWVFLSICGLAMAFVWRAIPMRYALTVFLTIITIPTFLYMPTTGERPILAVYGSAIIMCLALAAREHYRTMRRKRLT